MDDLCKDCKKMRCVNKEYFCARDNKARLCRHERSPTGACGPAAKEFEHGK